MSKISLVIHGGARKDSEFIREYRDDYKAALTEVSQLTYAILKKGKHALDAVEAAVVYMEDHILFNAGRGSAINSVGETEMEAAIMEGKELRSGAVTLLKKVKNPVSLARHILEDSKHILLGAEGALEYAKYKKVQLEYDSYFITPHQYDVFMEERDSKTEKEKENILNHGTVGAVAFDSKGNIAAATSTGGLAFNRKGRVGDACMIGIGCYANNKTCGVCSTGDGEINIRNTSAAYISMLLEHTSLSIQEACNYLIHSRNKDTTSDMGLIAIDKSGNIGISYNTELMHRAWISSERGLQVKIYEP
ncbi:MAG: Beta-aspartyl-peptidase [Bacteroidetes bacterium]|jgi:beta-aspartyl-peptidase (threonine type)|nr:Beta-aspartyl-peptidase [Bacteroidota bacterium]